MQKDIMGDMLTATETAEAIGRSVHTLAKDRWAKKQSKQRSNGPRHVVIGGRIYYRKSDLKAWVDASIQRSLDDDETAA